MGSNDIIIREYLESLKEDTELDYLFPILLTLMGYKVKSTPRHSKGQSQYGKDIVAVGNSKDGIRTRFYFEIKGYSDKDIDDRTFSKEDGVRDSIIASKDTPYNDNTDPEFNSLPVQIVFVHNGILKENTRQTFNGFIEKEFPNGGFERWDISDLTTLFGRYLFSEYLLTDEESLRLFKRTLVLLDAPENDFSDFKRLVDIQIEKVKDIKGRTFKKFFASLNLLSAIVLHYSNENNNLFPAKECLTHLTLKTWAWILRNKLENKKAVINGFRKLLNIHFEMLNSYFEKTLPAARLENGLYVEHSGPFEAVGYPLRSFEYLNYLIYYFQVRKYWPDFKLPPKEAKERTLGHLQKSVLIQLVNNNDGCARPLLDNHSIAILNVILFLLRDKNLSREEIMFMGEYLGAIMENISIIKNTRNRFPELSSNEAALTEFSSTGEKPHTYQDKSTLLITILFELIAVLNADGFYKSFKETIKGKINLQVALIRSNEFDIEQLLFEKHLDNEFGIEHSINLPDDLAQFKTAILAKPKENIEYRTDKAGFPFLRTLAHVYFKTEFFTDEWRELIKTDVSETSGID